MPSKKRKKRELQRRRRIERDMATAIGNNISCRNVYEKIDDNDPNRKIKRSTGGNQGNLDSVCDSSKIAGYPSTDSLRSWIFTWTGKKLLLGGFPSIIAILLVPLLSLVMGSRDYLVQSTGIRSASFSISKAVVYAALSVLLSLPFVLYRIIYNETQSDDLMIPSEKIDEKAKIIKDEFAKISPLGLRRSSKKLFGGTNETTEEISVQEDEAPLTPHLASSKHVRTKLAEWLPFGLRHTSDLSLVFSTNIHGRSLQTLYHILKTTSSNHTIMFMEVFTPAPSDTREVKMKRVIGMYASQRWHSSPNLYGDGRSFLFRLSLPGDGGTYRADDENVLESDCWKWTPPMLPAHCFSTSKSCLGSQNIENDNALSLWETFQRSNHSSLSLGISASGTGAGLQLNHDMTLGESHRAVGFENEPLCGTHGATGADQFDVGLVEVYQLVREIDGRPIQ